MSWDGAGRLYRYFVCTKSDCTDIDIQCTETGCTEKTCTESVCTEIVMYRKRRTPYLCTAVCMIQHLAVSVEHWLVTTEGRHKTTANTRDSYRQAGKNTKWMTNTFHMQTWYICIWLNDYSTYLTIDTPLQACEHTWLITVWHTYRDTTIIWHQWHWHMALTVQVCSFWGYAVPSHVLHM